MSLQRRLLLVLLVAAPLVWGVTFFLSLWRARIEINELFDTQQVRLARQVQATLPAATSEPPANALPPPRSLGDAGLEDLSIAVWDRGGRLLMADREGVLLPYRPHTDGFVDLRLAGEPWRVYYQPAGDGGWLVAIGQGLGERAELIVGLMVSQLTPWLVALPVLLVLIVGAVRHSMAPLRQLARDLEARAADERTPVSLDLPSELRPLVRAMNRLFDRVSVAIEHERRLTADAAHELRTPLAALRVQAEVAQLAEDPVARRHALGQLTLGIDRLSRVVAQLLDLARLDALGAPARVAGIDWARVVEQAVSECLPLAEERGSQIDCVWPAGAVQVLPLAGDETLIALLLRNLTDNALRYSQPGSLVEVVLAPQEVRVQDNGPGLPPAVLARLGERFYRPGGNDTRGSGLGLSIVRRVAGLHGLEVELANRPGGGFQVTLRLGSGPG